MTSGEPDWKIFAFVAFCVEEYKHLHRMEGGKVAALFEKTGVAEYLQEHFEVLQSLSHNALLPDVDECISSRRNVRGFSRNPRAKVHFTLNRNASSYGY